MFPAVAAFLSALVLTPVSCERDLDQYVPPDPSKTVMGLYWPGERRIALRAELCREIRGSLRGRRITDWQSVAWMTLGHEVAHSQGVVDEIAADCEGEAMDQHLMVMAGIRPNRAARIDARYTAC